jgi:hypothetical protein
MSDTDAVISAFLDDESFDLADLAEALSDPAGRSLLIDLLALRQIVQPEEAIASMAPATSARRFWRRPLAAAAVLLALAGGYFLGERRSAVDMADPPAPTRVVQATAWQILPTGGGR